MSLRRVLCGVLMAGLAAPLLAAAPHPQEPRASHDAIPAPPRALTTRVFARADAPADPDASPSPEPSSAPPIASSPSPEIAARARVELEAMRSGKIDRAHYSDEFNKRIPDTALNEIAGSLRPLGALQRFTQVRKVTQGSVALYVFRVEFEKPPIVEEAISWDASGKVAFLSVHALP